MSKPDFYSFIELAPEDTLAIRRKAAIDLQVQSGSVWSRLTLVSDEHPEPPYPNGLYLEGWRTMPTEPAPFDFPLTASK